MKHAWCVALVGLVGGLSVVSAQTNFSGTDDFSSDVGSNWTADTSEGSGSPTFTVSDGALQFSSGPLAAGTDGGVYRDWAPNSGALDADWTVYADFNINTTPSSTTQSITWMLFVFNPSDEHNENAFVGMTWSFEQMSNGGPLIYAYGALGGDETAIGSSFNLSGSSTATMGLSYDAANQQVIAGYDLDGAEVGGLNFVTFGTYDVSTWDMTTGDVFGARIYANNTAGSEAVSSGFGTGTTFDNFTAVSSAIMTASAVPEPAAIAGWMAAVCLAFAWSQRRRQRP